MKKNNEYWDRKPIMQTKADMMLIFGERSNGKTYGVLEQGIEDFIELKRPSVLIRRFSKTILPKNIEKLFNSHFKNGCFKKLKYDGVEIVKGKWCGFWYVEKNRKKHDEPFLYMTALNESETTKSTLPDLQVKNIFLDEFLTRDYYLHNEFIRFMNLVSTFTRDTTDCRVFLIGNTVSFDSPYFKELGLTKVSKMTQGVIQQYVVPNELGEDLNIAVEWCKENSRKSKAINSKWFAFDNPQLKMITKGKWEFDNYPHITWRTNEDVTITRDIYLENGKYQVCFELRRNKDAGRYVLVRPYEDDFDLTKAKRIYTDLTQQNKIFCTVPNPKKKIDKIIWGLYKNERFFYANNECGEIVRNFINQLADRGK